MNVVTILALVVMFITHEAGHIWLAKREGSYYGWGILPTPHVKLIRPFKSRWGYLSGIIGSVPSLPLFLVAGYDLMLSSLIIVSIGMLDLIAFLLYNQAVDGWDEVKEIEKRKRFSARFPKLTRWHIL